MTGCMLPRGQHFVADFRSRGNRGVDRAFPVKYQGDFDRGSYPLHFSGDYPCHSSGRA